MNLFYVDFDRPRDNGLSTYTQELLSSYHGDSNIQLHCIWINSLSYKADFDQVVGKVTHTHSDSIRKKRERLLKSVYKGIVFTAVG